MQLTDDEKKRGVACHEAGHAVLTLISRFFQLSDPAIVLAPTADRTAQSGTRPREPGLHTNREMSLEHVEIALAGKAGEMMLEQISEENGRPIVLHADSTEIDFQYANDALTHWEAGSEREMLLASALGVLATYREAWEEIAGLIEQRIGHQESLSKEEVESLPGAQLLMAKKRPL
jgi:hypothetical protein